MSDEPTVPVLCRGNNSKQYDDKTRFEKVRGARVSDRLGTSLTKVSRVTEQGLRVFPSLYLAYP